MPVILIMSVQVNRHTIMLFWTQLRNGKSELRTQARYVQAIHESLCFVSNKLAS